MLRGRGEGVSADLHFYIITSDSLATRNLKHSSIQRIPKQYANNLIVSALFSLFANSTLEPRRANLYFFYFDVAKPT